MERAGADGRAALTKAAHDAVRGMTRSIEELCKRAQGRERTGRLASKAERAFYPLLVERGLTAIPQKALWKYNIDFAIGNVAVEISGRAKKPEELPALRERTEYILNSGFALLSIWAGSFCPITVAAADYTVSYVQEASSDPSMIGKYRVIRGDGKFLAAGGLDDDEFPGILTPIPGYSGRS
jgi:very-short-patch-repair endonuclease